MSHVEITPIENDSYHILSVMVGELLSEIMNAINKKSFNYDALTTEKRAKELIKNKKYWVFMAKEIPSGKFVGFVSIYESFALYSEGAYGTIPELYVRPQWRSNNIGAKLIKHVKEFANSKDWSRLEVTTPPLPEFDRTLSFYQANEFKVSGGRKLMVEINA
ncbi:MAG: GNAT family N-acetyltransferase [Sedimenticola sp.]